MCSIYGNGCTGVADSGLVSSHQAYRPARYQEQSTDENTCTHTLANSKKSAKINKCLGYTTDKIGCHNDADCVFIPTEPTLVPNTTTCPSGSVELSKPVVTDRAECNVECLLNADCIFFIFDSTNQDCFLQSISCKDISGTSTQAGYRPDDYAEQTIDEEATCTHLQKHGRTSSIVADCQPKGKTACHSDDTCLWNFEKFCWKNKNWILVRSLPPGQTTWNPTTDNLVGNDVYGDPSDQSDPWSVKFDTFKFTEFLFAYGNFQQWAIT